MNKKTLGEELAFLRRQQVLTRATLADKIGIARSVISDYENGKAMPRSENLRKLAEVLGVSFEELLEKMEKQKKVAKRSGVLPNIEAFTVGKDGQATMTEVSEFVTLPVLGQVHAGDPNFIPNKEIIDVIKLPRRIGRSADYALQVTGMSMIEAGINMGDIVLVKDQPDAENNNIVIARIGDEYTIKRLRKNEKGEIWLEPANSRYKEINPPFEIVGGCVFN